MVAKLAKVDHWHGTLGGVNLGRGKRDELSISLFPETNTAAHLVNVDGGAVVVVAELVVVAHTDLTEVTRVVLVKVGTVVVLTTGKTTTSRMLPVLSDTTVTGRDVSAVLAGVGETGRHLIVSELHRYQHRRAQSCSRRRISTKQAI